MVLSLYMCEYNYDNNHHMIYFRLRCRSLDSRPLTLQVLGRWLTNVLQKRALLPVREYFTDTDVVNHY